MRNLRLEEDFVPVNQLGARAAGWLRRLAKSGAPLVVTQDGKPAGVLLSPHAFDELTERSHFVACSGACRSPIPMQADHLFRDADHRFRGDRSVRNDLAKR
jgi:prevent-host-death family protein